MKNEPQEILRCSFCNKDQDDVKKMVAGPTVFICNECVARCQEIIKQDDRQPPADVIQPRNYASEIAWFSAYSAWLHEESKAQRRHTRRLGMDRYFLYYDQLRRRQMRLLRWFGALIGAPRTAGGEYSPWTNGRRWCYTRGNQRLYLERRAVLDRLVFQIVITQPDGAQSVEEFSDIVHAIDRERELDRRCPKEGWLESEAV